MGLDVNLCRFKTLDTEAILKLSQFAGEPWAFEAGAGKKLKAKAHELGLPEEILAQSYFGGTGVSLPSGTHPEGPPVGEWSSFGGTRELMERFTGKDIYFAFPEAEAIGAGHGFFRPDWMAARTKLIGILQALRSVKSAEIEDYHAQFVTPQVPGDLLEQAKRLNPAQIASPSQVFAGELAQIEVMIETLDFVLNSENPGEFLLYWSA
jgi:hypothetical protein